jgi:hypothetical protein
MIWINCFRYASLRNRASVNIPHRGPFPVVVFWWHGF